MACGTEVYSTLKQHWTLRQGKLRGCQQTTAQAQGFRRLWKQRSTRVMALLLFILTDGEVWDETNGIVTYVQSRAAPSSARLKVHVLGIGSSVSTQMCQDIARAGNGVRMFATEAEDIVSGCIRLLTAGRTPHLRDVSIDWGVPPGYLDRVVSSSVNFSSTSHRTIRIKPPPVLQQAPTRIEGSIHAGTRMVIFAILTLRKVTVPKEVSLRGRLDGSTQPFEIPVPIRGVQLRDSEPGLPMIHVLAASRLIDEHDKNRASLPASQRVLQ